MANLCGGWVGYATSAQYNSFIEPADTAYARRPVALGAPDSGMTRDLLGGTVGPASAAWGALQYAGIFDAASGGNLLLWWPLAQPVTIAAGMTMTESAGASVFLFADLAQGIAAARTWPAGSTVATFGDGRAAVAGVALQLVNGVLSAQNPNFGSSVFMTNLPAAQPATGSGRLWNNGGVISVA